jgi:uncharacterized protein
MVIDLREIKRQGKDELDFFFEYQLDNSLIDIPNVTFNCPIKISGTVTLTGEHSAVVDGEIEFVLIGDCTRCLEGASRSYYATFSEDFGIDTINNKSIKGDKIDLTETVTETVLTNMPVSFLCSDDCKGLCFTCGTNLNNGSCNCNNK